MELDYVIKDFDRLVVNLYDKESATYFVNNYSNVINDIREKENITTPVHIKDNLIWIEGDVLMMENYPEWIRFPGFVIIDLKTTNIVSFAET